MKLKLSPSSLWLLGEFAKRHPLGFASTAPMHLAPKGVSQPDMVQVRGLQRRGFIKEACCRVPPCLEQCCEHSGIFYITGKGLDAAAEMKLIPKFKDLAKEATPGK